MGRQARIDSVRPATAIPYVCEGRQIQAWGGPGEATVTMDGRFWIPCQLGTFPTPPFPEYISGHSSFSAAGATVLELFTGSDAFGDSVTFAPGSSKIEPGLTPSHSIPCGGRHFQMQPMRLGSPDATAEFISRRATSPAGDRTDCWL